MPVSSQLLKPVRLRFVLFTVVVALGLALIPWGPLMRAVLPDFIALVLLYWALNQPRHVGVGWAFWLGIILDIADGNVFGQHSLAYCFTTYLATSRHRRVGMFPLWQQALYVAPLLLANQAIMVLVRLAIDRVFPGWTFFIGALSGAVLWPLMSQILQIPQRAEKPVEIQ
ncbi:rod shape-determining protein MreD [Chitinimonas sp.]|uniref:rod shape-determining protein MreD n=1 Tax=Chitinimonas sp. TaxID=1934313 RepID=UPI0035B1D746